MLIPVLRTILRWMYNRSTLDHSCFSRFLRLVLWLFPIDLNIVFHKLVAKVIVFATFGHWYRALTGPVPHDALTSLALPAFPQLLPLHELRVCA